MRCLWWRSVARLLQGGNHYFREKMIDKVAADADAGNISALVNTVSWAEFQENVKNNIGQKIVSIRENGRNDVPLAQLSVRDVNKILDYYVQPYSVEIILRIKKGFAPEYRTKVFVKETGFYGLTGFYVILSHPDQKQGDIRLRSQEVKVFFELRGSEWKITDADIPLIFVPTYIP